MLTFTDRRLIKFFQLNYIINIRFVILYLFEIHLLFKKNIIYVLYRSTISITFIVCEN